MAKAKDSSVGIILIICAFCCVASIVSAVAVYFTNVACSWFDLGFGSECVESTDTGGESGTPGGGSPSPRTPSTGSPSPRTPSPRTPSTSSPSPRTPSTSSPSSDLDWVLDDLSTGYSPTPIIDSLPGSPPANVPIIGPAWGAPARADDCPDGTVCSMCTQQFGAQRQVWSDAAGNCVACTEDAHCPSQLVCDHHSCVASSSSAVSCPDTQVQIKCNDQPYTWKTAQVILSNGQCTTSGKICPNVLASCGQGISSLQQYTKSGLQCELTP